MSEAIDGAYELLGVTPSVSDADLRRVYRALVKRHHPDHNGGSAESAAVFAQIQAAYAQITAARQAAPQQAPQAQDPEVERRIAQLERELAAARERERLATLAGQEALRRAAYLKPTQPTREQLGYYETDDSFSKILDDAGAQISERLRDRRRNPLTRALSDLFGAGE